MGYLQQISGQRRFVNRTQKPRLVVRPSPAGMEQLFGSESVADTLLGQDVAGSGGVVFQLSPQTRHEDTQVVRFMRVVWSPHFFEEKAVCQDFA